MNTIGRIEEELVSGGSRGSDFLLDIGSTPRKQGKFRANKAENGDFAVLDLTLVRIVNGADCRRGLTLFAAVAMGP
jgi:hypothetical protein